jgi:dual specificity phosphatase 12
MKEVREGLYIGNYEDAGMVKSAEIPPVSHVLSLVGSASASPSDSNWSAEKFPNVAKLQRLVVPLQDVDAQNLLDSLESCWEFIEKGRHRGGVLVHCVAGVSRSAAVVTAYLMHKEHLSAADALTSLRKSSPGVCPNYGFMEQLAIFENMGNKIDRDSPLYKKFKVGALGDSFAKGEVLESSSYASDPGIRPAASSVPNVVETQIERSMLYRCKKCRRVIARDENVLAHDVGGGEAAFNWKKRGTKRGMAQERPVCTSIFVEPMQWMTTGAPFAPLLSASCLFSWQTHAQNLFIAHQYKSL